jgi:hypothetical protein
MVDELDAYRTHTLMIPKAPLSLIYESTVKAIDGDKFVHFTGFKAATRAFALRHFPGLARDFADRTIRRGAKTGS